jgi:hypothetical protein
VCTEADLVLARSRHRIQDERIDGRHWAAHCYAWAVDAVQWRQAMRT